MDDKERRIEQFYARPSQWQAELALLRAVLLDCGLIEEFKWRGPCYTHLRGNVAVPLGLIAGCTLTFFKGVLLGDPAGILVAPGANSRIARMAQFQSVDDIRRQEGVLRSYIAEAKALEAAGAKVELPPPEINLPNELLDALGEDHELQQAWAALTPGRQRGYAMYFAQPVHSATRSARIAKSRERILAGKGMNDH